MHDSTNSLEQRGVDLYTNFRSTDPPIKMVNDTVVENALPQIVNRARNAMIFIRVMDVFQQVKSSVVDGCWNAKKKAPNDFWFLKYRNLNS